MKKNSVKSFYNYALFEIDEFGNKKYLHGFYTLQELNYYMDIKHYGISDLVSNASYYPFYKFRVFSYKLNQFI